METVKTSLVAGGWRGRGEKSCIVGAKRIFSIVKIFCDTIMVDTSHYTFVKTHRMYTKSRP